MEVITVTSKNQNPSRFVSNFINSINLSNNYEVGLLKIAHPPTANVTNENNKIYVAKKGSNLQAIYEIPKGFYATTHEIAQAIYDILKKVTDDYGEEDDDDEDDINTRTVLRYSTTGTADHSKLTLQLEDKKTVFVSSDITKGNVLKLLDYRITNFMARTLIIQNYDLQPKDQVGFIYSSIVSNSLIDYHVSRLLDTVTIKSSKNGGHCIFEVQNPVFHDVSAASFIDISFEIRNLDGEFIQFQNDLSTILTLGIRKKLKPTI